MKPKLLLLDEPCTKAKEIMESVCELVYPENKDGYTLGIEYIYTQLTPVVASGTVFCPCTGTDHVIADKVIYLDEEWKRNEGREVTSTAEHTWSLILQLAKKNKMQLKGKTLGIIGFGRIGKQVREYAKAFGMEVFKGDETEPLGRWQAMHYADILTLHVPLNENTKGMIGKEEFEIMNPKDPDMRKRCLLLVNTSRAEIVDQQALIEALHNGKLAGYANDFNVLPYHDKVIATNHIGGNCIEAREATDIYIANKIKEFAQK